MQSETDWLDETQQTQEAYKYFMRVDPEMREFAGPIETVDDPVTGRVMRQRTAKLAMLRGGELSEFQVFLDPLPHVRLPKGKPLQGWYSSKGDGEHQGMRERPCMTDAVLTQPYGGWCAVSCPFCYINSGSRGYRGSGLATVPIGYGEYVKKQLSQMWFSQAGYFSSFIDPFLPLEEYYHNTQQGATAFVEENLPIFFLSRLTYPGWAFDLLKRNPLSYAQKSINCCREEDWRRLSPGAISLDAHFQQIKELRRQDIYVSIQCNPVVAGIISHEDVEHTFERLAEAGTNHVIVKFVEASHSWAKAMVDKMVHAFGPERGQKFADLFTCNSGGGQKTIDEAYRLEGHRRYSAHAKKLGMTYATCYEYKQLDDGSHVSIGHDFLTGDTCHGHRIPMHVRPGPDGNGGPFKPLAVCPTSGCLTCGSSNQGKPKCGSELLGSAKALKLSDFKTYPEVKEEAW